LIINIYFLAYTVTSTKRPTISYYSTSKRVPTYVDDSLISVLMSIITFSVIIIIVCIISWIAKIKKQQRRNILDDVRTNNFIEAENQVIFAINSAFTRQGSVLSYNSALRNSSIIVRPIQQDIELNKLPTYEEYSLKTTATKI